MIFTSDKSLVQLRWKMPLTWGFWLCYDFVMKRSAVLLACCAALLLLLPPSAEASLPLSSGVVQKASDDAFFAALTKIVEDDIRAAAKSVMVEDDEDEVRATLMKCMKSMQQAYDAQMAFAVESLEIYRTAKPKLYAEALAAYRTALRAQYRNDLESLRNHYMWNDDSEEMQPTGDAFLDAPLRGSDGMGVRWQTMQRAELREGMLKLRRKLVRDLVEDRCSADGYEFLTDSSIDGGGEDDSVEMSPRCRKLLSLFDRAEQCWEEYARESGLSFYCPIRSWAGTDTYCMAYQELIYHLWEHHEAFLAELLGGFCGEED